MPPFRTDSVTVNPRVLAVDWSGARLGPERHIWLAEARSAHSLVRLEAGRDRQALAVHLLAEATRDPRLVIGLDFSFGFPAWFTQTVLGVADGPSAWAQVARLGETWLASCEPPFWGRPGRGRPTLAGPALRWTERAVPRAAGSVPKSVFQVGGAGSVGTGSLRGMPLLLRLREAGACVWPFQAGGWPLVIEIYPRLLTGRVAKSQAAAREALLAREFPDLDVGHRRLAVASEDAFDAAVSALVMARHVADLADLPPLADPPAHQEGRIWHPAWRTDVLQFA
jgi:uncharacterized protein DUF429